METTQEKRTSIPLEMWTRYKALEGNKGVRAKCRRIALLMEYEYGFDPDSVDITLFREFRESLTPETWRSKYIPFLKLFSLGLSHKEGVGFGQALHKSFFEKGDLKNENRISALLNQDDLPAFFQALSRLISQVEGLFEVDLGLLEKNLRRFEYGDGSVRLRWIRDLYTVPKKESEKDDISPDTIPQ